jgi:hypothetical protein
MVSMADGQRGHRSLPHTADVIMETRDLTSWPTRHDHDAVADLASEQIGRCRLAAARSTGEHDPQWPAQRQTSGGCGAP